jgi:hypothetical protein
MVGPGKNNPRNQTISNLVLPTLVARDISRQRLQRRGISSELLQIPESKLPARRAMARSLEWFEKRFEGREEHVLPETNLPPQQLVPVLLRYESCGAPLL